MRRRSIGGFITGLIGIILGVPIGFYAYIVLILVLALGGHSLAAYSVYLFFPALFFAILGVCFYFTKARLGGLFMLIATLLYVIPFICGILSVVSAEGATVDHGFISLVCFGNIPTLLTFISSMLGLTAKAKEKVVPYIPFQQPPQQPPHNLGL